MIDTSPLTSRERMLNAIDFRPTDRVPLLFRFWSLGGDEDNIPFNWRDEVERVEHTLALGLDDTITLQPPLGYVEDYVPERLANVSSYTKRMSPGQDDKYPLLKKVYETPDGPLQTIVSLTDDWPYGNDIKLFDDHNIPRIKEPLIKTAEDILRLRHLLADPSEAQLADWRNHAASLRKQAERLGVVLDGGWVALGDAAIWLCGMERILYDQMDEPQFIEQLLDVLHAWEIKRIAFLLEEGVDVVVHMAWYETTDFWTPSNYRLMLKPRLAKEIELTHQAGKKYRYIITKAWKPYRQDFLEMGIDCLTGVDPVQDKIDLAEIKRDIGGQICLMGGLNSAVMFSQWNDEEIEEAAEQAIRVMAPGGGYIGFPVDAIFNTLPWEKVEIFLRRWDVICRQNHRPGQL